LTFFSKPARPLPWIKPKQLFNGFSLIDFSLLAGFHLVIPAAPNLACFFLVHIPNMNFLKRKGLTCINYLVKQNNRFREAEISCYQSYLMK